MTKKNIFFKRHLLLILLTFSLLNCSKDDDPPATPTGKNKEYNVLNTNFSDLNGTINFAENTNGSTTILVQLNNTFKGIDNPVRLRRNTANIGGGIALELNEIQGENGKSSTTISKLANGTIISYNELSEFDGYLAIEDSSTGVLVAYADLGPNERTGNSITYNLFSPEGAINGLALFEERKKGTTSLTINVFDINQNTELPSSLHILRENISPEVETYNLNSITSELNGYSFNEIKELNNTTISYSELLNLNGQIQILDATDTNKIISSGGIGINENANSN
ncbi:hypothetical protein PXC01_05920 [Maribacter sp. M208]|uniref:hypothetical protein n=1 Tax=Maribacter huludaoensis TaxID=3030010 RepID=UPI0023EC1AF2|nr:hypothetical protein [Maribacter huludaoensis]MDF4221117.1 hypothetical protein [Maribacter huludaoensis]